MPLLRVCIHSVFQFLIMAFLQFTSIVFRRRFCSLAYPGFIFTSSSFPRFGSSLSWAAVGVAINFLFICRIPLAFSHFIMQIHSCSFIRFLPFILILYIYFLSPFLCIFSISVSPFICLSVFQSIFNVHYTCISNYFLLFSFLFKTFKRSLPSSSLYFSILLLFIHPLPILLILKPAHLTGLPFLANQGKQTSTSCLLIMI